MRHLRRFISLMGIMILMTLGRPSSLYGQSVKDTPLGDQSSPLIRSERSIDSFSISASSDDENDEGDEGTMHDEDDEGDEDDENDDDGRWRRGR